jgi:hypothetical protein
VSQVLPVFSVLAKCLKCGSLDIGAKYLGDKVVERLRRDVPEEAMLRECRYCGFQWKESPLDMGQPRPVLYAPPPVPPGGTP